MRAKRGPGIRVAPPVGEGGQADVVAAGPLDEAVGTGADRFRGERVGGLPDLAGAGQWGKVENGRQQGVGLGGQDVEGEVVDGGGRYLRTHELGDVEGVLGRPGVVDPKRRVLGGERIAVVEGDPLAKREADGPLVLPFPGGCQLAHQLVGDGITVEQRLVDVAQHRVPVDAEGVPPFQGGGLGGQRDDYLAGRRCRVLGKS